MKLKKIPASDAEHRPLPLKSYRSEFGRSSAVAVCPFCGTATEVYVWSLSGSGKRCSNLDCRSLLRYGIAYRDMVPIDEAER